MKLLVALFALTAMLMAGCDSQNDVVTTATETESVQATDNTENEIKTAPEDMQEMPQGMLAGKVLVVDGNMVTVQMGEWMDRPMDEHNGEIPEMDGNAPDKPEGMEPPAGEMSENGERPAFDENGTPPEAPDGESFDKDAMKGGSRGFVAREEEAVLDLTDAEIILQTADGSVEGSISDITVGSILLIEKDDSGNVKTVTVCEEMDDTSGRGGDAGTWGDQKEPSDEEHWTEETEIAVTE